MIICKDCDGKGYVYSDPDKKQMVCSACDGEGVVESPEEWEAEERRRLRRQWAGLRDRAISANIGIGKRP